MSDLYVLDVSAIVHTGMNVASFKERSYYDYPVGGIHFLMRYVSIALAARDDVVLCFDSPSFRKELYQDYKAGRLHNPSVISQIESVFEGLSACGVKCEKFDDYEADDIVDWAVQQNVKDYSEVIIVGNDYDLCHSIQQKVRFKTVNHNMNNIYWGNFENSIEQGKCIYFNTISAYKVLFGCSSDHLPAFHASNGMSNDVLYQKFIQYFSENEIPRTYSNTINWKVFILFAKSSGLFTKEEQLELLRRVKIVYPAECPADIRIVPTSYSQVDKDRLFHFLTMYNDYDSIRCLSGRKSFLSEDDKQMIRDKGRKLRTGEFATDRNLEHAPKVTGTTLKLDSFTKEF